MEFKTHPLAALAVITLGILPATAQTDRYWTGTGTWNTAAPLWATSPGGTYDTLWAGGDNAIFEGTAGTVTLGEDIDVTDITFASGSGGTSQYTIGGNTLNFAGGGMISNLNGTNTKIQTITSAITGAPNVDQITSSSGGDINGGIKFAPTGGATQDLGTVTLAAGYPGSSGGADKTTLWLSGTTTGNTIRAVDQNTNYSLIRKSGSGAWTLTGVAKFGRFYMDDGDLVVTGTLQSTQYQGFSLNNGTLHYNNPGAVRNSPNLGQAFDFNGGSLDNTSGAAITTSTYNPLLEWNGNVAFVGSNGADSDLNLGNGGVTLTGSRTVTVQNAATTLTVGGVIAGSGHGLTKDGPGALALHGVNSYTGPTTLAQGTLEVNGSIASASTVTVNAGTLSGNGTIHGTLDVPPASTLTMGNAGGMLNVDNVDLDGTLDFEIRDTDQSADAAMAVLNDLDIAGATLALNITAETVQADYVIATYGSLTGTFAGITGLPAGWGIDYTYNTADVIAIVPPAPVAPPAQPTGLAATAAISADGSTSFVELDWNAAGGAARYTIKRSTTSGGPYTPVATTRLRTYQDADVVVGQAYYYVVSAGNDFAEGVDSGQAGAVPVAPPPPSTPTGLVAVEVNGLMSLNWEATAATSGYVIRRATGSGGPYTDIGTATTNSYLVASGVVGTTYHYVVAATNSGGVSGDSDEVSALFSGDPLVVAVEQLEAHINGTTPLTATEIEQASLAIKGQTGRFSESVETITTVFDLVNTYDTVSGPLWVATGNLARASQANDLTWTILRTMQSIMDEVYQAGTFADPSKVAVIENYNSPGGFMFGSSARFPGPCDPPADPGASHTVPIQGSFDNTFGRNTQGWTLPARKPTGCYLAPGTTATITVPPALVGTGYNVRIGAHSWDLANRPELRRLDRATLLYPLDATTIKVGSPYGGGVYIEVPLGASAGVVNVTVTGAARSPYFSAKSFHQTTNSEWATTEKNHPAPWADFQSDKFMTQVPTNWVYAHPDPEQLMADWDAAMDAINDLMGFPRLRGKETMYPQVDVILRSSVHAPGYPAVNVADNPNNDRGGYHNNYIVRGPGASPTASHIEFHEQGHAYFFPKFGGESESNVNLLQPAMLHRKFGYDIDVAQRASVGSGNVNRTLDNTAVAWMCVFNFSPREAPMATAEKVYQHKGHAKFMDIARLFGWEGMDDYWFSFMDDDANGIPYGTGTDDLLLRLSRHVGRDIRPLFHFWGIHPQNAGALESAIAAESIPASTEIRDLLLNYKTLVPADNAAFRTFALAWWGREPSINGFWEEREHARQWDTTALYGAGDQQRSELSNPGEIYNENSASEILDRIDELVALYFPGTIIPNPMGFAVAPAPVDATTIEMTALTATASTGPVEYYFENTTNGNFRDWGTDTSWSNGGLTIGVPYNFRVKARDGDLNETAWSDTASATITPPDTTAPTPSPMSFASAPAAAGETSITMTATTANDPSGVEYFFECTTVGGNDSGWQDSRVYADTGLTPSTAYTYRVRARDKSPAGTATAWSGTASATTDAPDTTAPTPNPMTFAANPSATGAHSITMTASTATDPSGVEYFFECTAGNGNDSGWQDSPVYTDTGLDPETEYTYRVRARDKSAAATATAWSAALPATTTVSSPETLYRSAGTTWDTAGTVWSTTTGGPYDTTVWSNGDSAVFEGTPGTVSLGETVTLGGLSFTTNSGGYTVDGNTLNFTAGGTISCNDHRYDQTITSAITGSPAVNIRDYNPTGSNNTYKGLRFAPTGGTQSLGAVLNPDNTGNKDKAGFTMAGSTAGNTVASIDYAGGDRYADTNVQSGGWSVAGNVRTGTLRISGGTIAFGGSVGTYYNDLRATGGTTTGAFTLFTNDRRGSPHFADGATVAPGNSVGTITVTYGTGGGNPTPGLNDYSFSLRTGSTYEWEVGAANATDTIHVTEGALILQDFTLKILDAGGTPEATDQLPVFTYDAGVTIDMSSFPNSASNFDTSALGPEWTVGTLALTDNGSDTIYLTGLSKGAATSPYSLWAATNAPGGGPGDDYDGDTVPNALEFVLGGTATTNDVDKLPVAATSGGDMTFTFLRDQASIDGTTTVTIEVGTDLNTWPNTYNVGADTAGSDPGVSVAKDTPAPGTDTVTLTLARTPDARKFGRLAVQVTP